MASEFVVEITDSNFEEHIAKAGLALVDFWAPWCGPCRQIGPVIEQIASELQGKAVVGKVNVDKNPQLSQKFKIQAIPSIFILQHGEVKEKIVGNTSKANILSKLTLI